jgi:hypothetical protein
MAAGLDLEAVAAEYTARGFVHLRGVFAEADLAPGPPPHAVCRH